MIKVSVANAPVFDVSNDYKYELSGVRNLNGWSLRVLKRMAFFVGKDAIVSVEHSPSRTPSVCLGLSWALSCDNNKKKSTESR